MPRVNLKRAYVAPILCVILLPCIFDAATIAASPHAATSDQGDQYVEHLIYRARELKLAKQTTWMRLGHWRPGWFGGTQSDVDGRAFFVSPKGATDPQAEMEATLRAFFAPPRVPTDINRAEQEGPPAPSEHAACRFPARLGYLHEALNFDLARIPVDRCPAFMAFWERLAPRSITLLFSSYYLSTPASMFGHTFLRINKAAGAPMSAKRRELLDFGVDFSADVDTTNSVIYAFKGLTGLFRGTYKVLPYYYKVREYNDYESRDLWAYDLNLSPKAVTRLVAHLWEFANTHYNYYYITENCSYHILSLIEAADPKLDLLSRLRSIVVPADTVKALFANTGLVGAVHYRPSVRRQFRSRIEGLSWSQKALVADLADDPNVPLPGKMTEHARVRVLDAAADLVDMRYARDLIHHRDNRAARIKQTLLQRRAAIPVTSAPLVIDPPVEQSPEKGHGSRRLGIGVGVTSNDEVIQTVSYRSLLHDLIDPAAGYPELAQMEFLPFQLRFRHGVNKIRLDYASAFRIATLNPITQFSYPISWKLDFGAATIEDRVCDYCLSGRAVFGSGGTVSFVDDAIVLFAMLDLLFAGSPSLGGIADSPIRLGFGPSGGARIRLLPTLNMLVSGQWIWLPGQTPNQTWLVDGGLRWGLDQHIGFGLVGRGTPRTTEGRLELLFYF